MSRKLTRTQARAMAAARKPEQRKGAARKPSYCGKCGALCDSARQARVHC